MNGIKKKRRLRREAISEDELEDKLLIDEDDDDDDDLSVEVKTNSSSSLSENVRMFQSIHVLQSRDEEFQDEDGNLTEIAEKIFTDADNVCMSSMIFASVFGALSLVALMSSVTVSLLCLRLKRAKKLIGEDADDEKVEEAAGNYRGGGNVYVHSRQQRIP